MDYTDSDKQLSEQVDTDESRRDACATVAAVMR
jgi:hypothetical protein